MDFFLSETGRVLVMTGESDVRFFELLDGKLVRPVSPVTASEVYNSRVLKASELLAYIEKSGSDS